MGEVIAVTSGKGGVGKSNISLHLGATLAKQGYRVVLVDMDLGLKNLDVMMGLENRVIYDLLDVMKGNCSLSQALIKDKHMDTLFLLPACKSVHLEQVEEVPLKKVIGYLKQHYDYVFLDSAAGLESGFHFSISCCDQVIIVATLDYTSLNDADRVIGILLKSGIETIRLVLNKVNPRYIEKGFCVSIKEALTFLALDLLGIVYEEETMIKNNNKGYLSLQEDGMIKDCFACMAARLQGENNEFPKYRGKSLLQRMFG